MSEWQANSVINLSGQTIIVTGGNCGLGYESVKYYASKGAEVIMTSRSIKRGEVGKAEILKDYPTVKIRVMSLDLGDLESIRKFADCFISEYSQLNILMNNAGVMTNEYASTKDGFEIHMGVNHIGHYILTGYLLSVMKETAGARVVNISSLGLRRGTMEYDKFLYDKHSNYEAYNPYGSSKLANLFFTYELQRRIEEAELDIKVLAAHPGGSMTNLVRDIEEKWWFRLLTPLFHLTSHSAYYGALPGIRASLDKTALGGQYYGPAGMGELRGKPVVVSSSDYSHSEMEAKKLWKETEKLTGMVYNFNKTNGGKHD